jgi:nucleotide-binding universal stress UspA family protein
MEAGPVLVCYDGSEAAQAAIDVVASLLASHVAVVACYWQPFAASDRRLAVEMLELVQKAKVINERQEALALTTAEEGAERAASAGLDAHGVAIRIDSPIDEAILTHAEELDAAVIVLGARGRTKFRSLILGNVANEVVQRATRPVIVVPSRVLSLRRREELSRDLPEAEPRA